MMIRRNLPAAIPTALLAMAGLTLVVRAATSASDDAGATKLTVEEPKRAEAKIWALEDAYWEANRDADHEGIISTWHDRFLGWPEGEPRPIDKAEGARFVRENYAQPASYSFEIERTGIVVLGDVAVNHYTVHLKSPDAEEGKKLRSLRITHTLVRGRTGWKVLGGMSASP
jgi:ketosteroid isomerase-like protein